MEGTLSPADVAVLTGNNRNNNDGLFGGDMGGLIALFLLFGLGFGNGNGGGLFGGGNSGAANNYVLASDFATLQRQIDSATTSLENKGDRIQEQQCNSDNMRANQIAAIQASLMNGFAGVNQGISNNRYETQLAVGNAQNGITNAITGLGTQLQECCCQNRYDNLQNSYAVQNGINGLNTSLLMGNNALQNTIQNGFCESNYNLASSIRDVVDNQNANTRAILDSLTQSKLEAKDNRISELENMLNTANLRASQAAQTNALDNRIDRAVEQLQPTPRPAYVVANPYCNCNNGCGCGNYNF